MGVARDPEKRFWAKVEKTDTCWLFTGALDKDGYGKFHTVVPLSPRMAHRYAYELLVGPIEEAMQIDHLCRVKACVNPAHLEPVTQQENMHRAPHKNRGKPFCKNGHPFDEANTRVGPDGRRTCRECSNRYSREYKRRVYWERKAGG